MASGGLAGRGVVLEGGIVRGVDGSVWTRGDLVDGVAGFAVA